MRLSAGDRIGPFEVLECLGDRDETTTFRAFDTSRKCEVALKVLPRQLAHDPEWLTRFRLDSELLNSLRHPGIPSFYDVHQIDGITAVALQFVEGTTPQPPMPVDDAIRIVLQIAEVLRVAHRSGIAHRNLTPDSILLPADGDVRVLNFGLGRRLRPADHTPDAPTMTIGADPISPHEFRSGENDYQLDIRATGELLVHLLGNHDDLPSAVQDAMARARGDDPNRRFASIAEFSTALEQRHSTTARERAITVRSFLTLSDDGNVPAALSGEQRYTDMGLLGQGGMGEVRRVRDRALNRILAMKIVKAEMKGLQGRFVQEARITAQLEHPAIVPVHEIGSLSDGRLYFTMKEVHGQTFSAAIRQAHASWRIPEAFRLKEARWTLRQLVGLLQRVSAGVGYAHSRGVLHRDLKPSNMMIGAFGEALVLDWGLTSVGAAPTGASREQSNKERAGYEERGAITDSTRTADERTLFGSTMGTPGFMAPEQGTGDLDKIGPQSDVFSLGCVLFNILTGSAPESVGRLGIIGGKTLETLSAPPVRAAGENGPLVPRELWAFCRIALAQNPEDRYPNAGYFSGVLESWLDGAQRREQAMVVLDRARELKPQSQALGLQAAELENQASGILAMMPPWAPVEAKRGAWAMQDRAAHLRSESEAVDAQFTTTIHAALSVFDDLPPAHRMLAEYYKQQHAAAETARHEGAVARYATLLALHDNGSFAAYLKGDGALTLVTDPPNAQATLYRYESVERRLIPSQPISLGSTPIAAHPLPMGSYLVKLTSPGCAPVDYPVFIERELHWDGVRPGGAEAYPIRLPKLDELGPNECYVPAGWFWSGGDSSARNGLPGKRLWLDGFVTPRDPVTVGEYLVYLNGLVDEGRAEEAAAAVPPIPAWESQEESSDREFGFSREASGRYKFDGGEEKFSLPVAWVSWYQAKDYSTWLAAHDGKAWSLMQEMQHEKASRGVDARYFPWGNQFDATFCAMRDSHSGAGRVIRFHVNEFPLDESPYGVRGCAGNTFAWCQDAYNPTGPDIRNDIPYPPDPAALQGPGAGGAHRIMRGGSYRDSEAYCRTSFRDCPPAICHYDQVGFRVARPLK